MLRQIKVSDLCAELENQLTTLGYSNDSMQRYKKVFEEFIDYTGNCDYSQSVGTDFLVNNLVDWLRLEKIPKIRCIIFV